MSHDLQYSVNIDLVGNQLKNASIHRVSADILEPEVGQIWFRTDLKVYRYFNGSTVETYGAIEFNVTSTHLQWRPVGTASWINIMELLPSGLNWKGTWDASTNTPTIVSGTGTNGDYYKVSVAGTTEIDGISEWGALDWIIFNGTEWQKIDNTDTVSSVAGKTGAVTLDGSDITNVSTISGTTISDALDTIALQLHTQDTDKYLDTQVTRTLYVDSGRTDLYTANGSITRPYKTIQDAINQIVVNNDNALNPYNIFIHAGEYYENLVLESLNLRRIKFTASGTVQIKPTSGTSFRSISNNTNISMLHVKGITFLAPIEITGATGSTAFDDVIWEDCNFVPGVGAQKGTITLNCINNFSLKRASVYNSNIAFNNLNYGLIENCNLGSGTVLSVSMDSSANLPSWGAQGGINLSGSILTAAPMLSLAGPTKYYQFIASSSRLGGATSTTIIPEGMVVIGYASYLRGTWDNNGSLYLRNTNADTLTGTAPILSQPTSQIKNDSNLPGDTLKDALNNLTQSVTYTQAFVNATEVVVTHNMNRKPSVTVIGSDGFEVTLLVEHVDVNTLKVYSNSPLSGLIVCN